ncbi:exported minor pilin protein [Yersinia intermedia]|uniref:Exported minor pilin protein n=1 Tax=Yersinia intermedia TaxID=631 RepID=A0A0H5LXB9_YERIN|nr:MULTISPECIES: fimbrial protein [Yersinia]CRY55660.1 exported minor pilin protein [Yersinia intermedia]
MHVGDTRMHDYQYFLWETNAMISLKIRHSALCLLILSPIENSQATALGWGRVNMQGAVIETACAIDTNSRDQTIDMSLMPLSQIMRDGRGSTRSFSIKLINCVMERIGEKLPKWQRFQVTFDGRIDNGLFGIDGTARGIALELADNDGKIVTPGIPSHYLYPTDGESELNYSMRLVSNQQILHIGEYTSTIRFKMEYY